MMRTLLPGGRGNIGSGLRTYLPRLNSDYHILSVDLPGSPDKATDPNVGGDSWEIDLVEVLKAIAGESTNSADGTDGLRAVEMAYGVYESNATGSTVKL